MTSTSEWNKFFTDAGIPRSVAAQYAATFHENRIDFSMLMDLNKEYLKDMNITILGDIISILKHTKEVQGKITSEKVLKSDGPSKEANPVDSKLPVPSKNKEKTLPGKPERTVTTMTSRLGPPTLKEFGAKPAPVFSRLDDKIKPVDKSEDDPGKSGGILRQRIPPTSERSSDTVRTLKRPSEKTHDKRVSFGGNEESGQCDDEASARKRKKYVVVKTLKTGEKIKTVVDADDPILSKYPIMKVEWKKFAQDDRSSPVSRGRDFSSASTLSDRAMIATRNHSIRNARPISPPRSDAPGYSRQSSTVSTTHRSLVSDRVRERKRISPPRDSIRPRSSSSSNLDPRGPQRSVKKRLSLPSSRSPITSPRSPSRYRTVPRERITGPEEEDTFSDHGRNYGRSVSSRLGHHSRVTY